MNGAQYVIDFFNKKGINVCFGYPGGAVLPLYDALKEASFQHILTRHEQGAIHAAEGYARVTGKTGVVFATSGPGATNLVTGLADAFLDSTPIFAITGQVASSSIGKDSFQEADVTGITIPVTKYNQLVRAPQELPRAMELAWQVAQDGRKGPVLLDITKNVFTSEIPQEEPVHLPAPGKDRDDIAQVMDRVLSLLEQSEKPLILVGGGVSASDEACQVLNKLAQQHRIPVATTVMGKGAVDETAEYALGTVGMHGLPAANILFDSCDLLLAVGTRFSDRVVGDSSAFQQQKKIIHVDIDGAELHKNLKVDLAIHADAKDFFHVLSYHLEQGGSDKRWEQWYSQMAEKKREYPLLVEAVQPLKPQYVITQVMSRVKENSPVVTDVGQHQMFAAQICKMKMPHRFVTSGGLGTMGFGLPAAMGAALAEESVPTVLFVGDGGFQMTLQELATIMRYHLPVKIFIMDNTCLGMVRQWQELFYGENYSQSILDDNPDFVTLASAYSMKAFKVSTPKELDETLDRVMDTMEPVLIHCVIDPKENVYPMVPPGENIDAMMGKAGKKYIIKEVPSEDEEDLDI